MKEIDSNDPVASFRLDESYGKLEFDADGYERFIPSPEEKVRMEAWLWAQITNAQKDYEPYFNRVRENIATYEALPQQGEVLQVPIAKRDANQTIAWTLTTLLRPRPLISVDPYFKATYNTLVPASVPDPMSGMMMEGVREAAYDAEEVAAAMEIDAEYTFREKINIAQLLETVITDCITGASPSWVKVCYDRTYRTVRTQSYTKTPEGWVSISGKEEKEVAAGNPVKILTLPVFSVLVPADSDETKGPFFERAPMSTTALREGLSSGEFDLVDPAEWDNLVKSTGKIETVGSDQIRQQVDRRYAATPTDMHDRYECWFQWPVKIEEADELGKVKKRFKMLQLCVQFHYGAKKLLAAYRHPYDHGMPVYVPFFQRRKPHRFAGGSLVEDVSSHQRLLSQMLHLDIKNAVQANNFLWWAESETEAFKDLTESDVKSGLVVAGKEGEDFGAVQTGSNHTGLGAQIGFVNQDATLTTGVSDLERGGGTYNRTAASTISQILQAGLAQPFQFIRNLNDGVAKVLRLYYETRRQYEPTGWTAPYRDPVTNELLDVPVRMPVEAVLDNFKFSMTAADELASEEADFEQMTITLNVQNQIAQSVAQIMGPAMNPQMPPSLVALLSEFAKGQLETGRLILERTRRDPQKFLPPRSVVDALVAEREQMMMQMQQMPPGDEGVVDEAGQAVEGGGQPPLPPDQL